MVGLGDYRRLCFTRYDRVVNDDWSFEFRMRVTADDDVDSVDITCEQLVVIHSRIIIITNMRQSHDFVNSTVLEFLDGCFRAVDVVSESNSSRT